MSDQEIQVKITADVANMLKGMQEAKESVEKAASGMKGDLGAMAESFEHLGAAALGMGAAGLAMEGMKETFNWVKEAIKETNELAESFRNLGYATGATVPEINGYLAAMEMSGGNMERLDGLMVGMQRGIKANSDVLIANGVAASKAALDGMSFVDYLRKVSEIADEMATPTERTQFLILALGRGAANAGAQLKEFVEHLEEGKKLTQDGGPVSDKSISNLKATEEATGRLNTALKTNASLTADGYSKAAIAYTNWRADAVTWSNKVYEAQSLAARGLIQYQYQADGVTVSIGKMMEAAQKFQQMERNAMADSGREMMHAQNTGGGKEEGRKLTTKADLEEQKKAAEEAKRLAKEEAAERERIWKEQSAQAVATYEWEQQYLKKAAKEKADAAKEEAREEMAAAKDGFTMKQELLNQDLAMGRITVAQKLAAEREFLDQMEMLEIHALAQEQLNDATNLKRWQELENKKLDISRKAALDRQKIENQAELDTQKKWQTGLDKMTQDWDKNALAMAKGQMSFSEGFKNATQQMTDQFQMGVIHMGEDWAKGMALQLLTSKETHASENLTTAKSAAGHAYDAVVGIPYVGPFLAPAAAAVAFAGVMAFAEGGWDRVPADQVAMIHKNEMVLPAGLAEGARRAFAEAGGPPGGSGGGGETHVHLHVNTMDAKSFAGFLNQHQGALGKVLGTMASNRRTS